MIIDGQKFPLYLRNTGLRAEQFYLLYRIMVLESNLIDGITKVKVDDKESYIKEFAIWSEDYERLHAKELNSLENCFLLEEKEFLEIHIKEKDRVNLTSIPLSKMKVTSKFKSYFLISDAKQAFYDFIDIYPMWVIVKGTRFPSKDLPEEQLIELYHKHITKGGNALLHERCLLITKRYLDSNDSRNAPMRISKFITEVYDGVAEAIEKEAQYDNDRLEA